MSRRCCFCAFEGPERAVKAHISGAHPDLRPPLSFGRSKGSTCPLCGFVHDEIARPDWAVRRKRFERGKIIAAAGGVVPGGQLQTLGTFVVPPGVSKIRRIELRVSPCRGPFIGRADGDGRRFCLSCKRPHFDAGKPLPGKCRFMLTRDGRMIQCDLPLHHNSAHEIPAAWRRWWESGQLGLASY